jgi:hypothetical protein
MRIWLLVQAECAMRAMVNDEAELAVIRGKFVQV